MIKKDAFSGFHPLVSLMFFTLAVVCSVVFMHPVCLGISLFCGVLYMFLLERGKAFKFALMFLLPMFLLAALINPIFSHAGVTVISYFPNGNPLTLESVYYGFAAACMIAAVMCWFRCFTVVMTSDKLLCLFGKVIPALSLVLAMALRFIPRFTAQMKAVANAQRGVGRDVTRGNLMRRARHGIKILSITVTWALENAIETADSMKSRGYGLPGRSSFSILRFDKRDRLTLVYLMLCGALIFAGAAFGKLKFFYFPITGGAWEPLSFALFAVYLALFALPAVINTKESAKWKR